MKWYNDMTEQEKRSFQKVNAFSKLNDKLVKDKILIRTKTDKYYLNR